MKIYILDYGALELDANVMLRFATRGRRSDPNPPGKWIRIPVWGALIETAGHRILFDLGAHPRAMEGAWPPALADSMPVIREPDQYVDKQLEKLGLAPRDIDTVILSHLHADHYGAIEQFGHCDVYLPKEDWLYALMRTHETADPWHGGTYIKSCIEAGVKKYHPVETGDDFELFPGLEIITLPGHAPGLLGLVARLERDGTLIFPSDALSMQETYENNVIGGIPYDGPAYERSLTKLRRLEQKVNAKVMLSHSAQAFASMRRLPDHYE